MILRSRGAKAPLLSVDLMPARVALNLRESGAVFPCKWCSVAEIYSLTSITLLIVNFRCCGYHHYGEYLDYIKLLVAAVTQTAPRPFCSAPAAAGRRRMQADRVPQKEQKIAAAVYLYQVDNDGEWGEIRFDFATGTAEIVRLAEWDTIKSNVFARTVIRHIQSLLEVRLLKETVVMFDQAL